MAERPVRIITKRTAVPGKIPTGTTGTELNLIKAGELASNLADKKLFSFDGSSVFEFGSNSFLYLTGGTITGNLIVTGISYANEVSATTYYNLPTDVYVTGGTYDNSTGIATFTNSTGGTFSISGFTTGSTSSAVFTGGTVSGDTIFLGNLSVSGQTSLSGLATSFIDNVNYINFLTNPNIPSPTGGTLFYDNSNNALSYKPITTNNDVTIQIGQENIIPIYNDLLTTILNGSVLSITGSNGSNSTVALAYAGGEELNNLYQVDGVATHDILPGETGFMTKFGYVRDLNLSAFTTGEDVYLSQTTPGELCKYSDLFFTGRTSFVGHVIDNSSLGTLEVNIDNEPRIGLVTSLESNILNANNSSNGVFEFSGLSKVTNTTFSVAPIKGWIVNNTSNYTSPTVKYVTYNGGVHTDNYVTTSFETFVYLTSGGTIGQQNTPLTDQQRRENIFLGKLGHPDKTAINLVFSQPDYTLSPLSQLRDMFAPINLINGGIYPSTNGANLKFNTSAGYIHGLGINYTSNSLSPNSLYISGASPCTFQYRTQTGGTTTNVTDIDPLYYDDNGVKTAITGTKATNQRIYLLQNGSFRVMYGQHVYTSISLAVEALQTETFVPFPNFVNNAVLIGILTVLSTATDLTDTSKARFFFASKFGETIGAVGGVSTSTLQQAYNNSSNPEIVTNSVQSGVQFRGGTGNDTDKNIIIENNAGTETSWITASGDSRFNSVSSNTISDVTRLTFNSLQTGTTEVGQLTWNTSEGTLNLGMLGGNVVQQIGLESYVPILNTTISSGITNGTVVRIAGVDVATDKIVGSYMIADGTYPYYTTLGVATENILSGDTGYINNFGIVRDIDTTGALYGETWLQGDVLYVSPTILGGLTNVIPQAPNLKIEIGLVLNVGALDGSMFVRPSLGFKLGDLHNVENVGSESNGDLLFFSGSSNTWVYGNELPGNYQINGNLTMPSGILSASTINSSNFSTQGIQYTNGPSYGYVLTSDASGFGYWNSVQSDTNTIYISANFGSDINGTGLINKPYQTLAKAILEASGNTNSVIIVYPGLYTESTVAIPDNIHIIGYTINAEFTNGFSHSSSSGVSNVGIIIENLNIGTFTIDSSLTANSLINIKNCQVALDRLDSVPTVLITISESTMSPSTINGGTNSINECLVVGTVSAKSGSTIIFENSKFVFPVEAEGTAVVRMLDCSLFGPTDFINGTIVGGNTPIWEVDASTNYLGGFTGSINKVQLFNNDYYVTGGTFSANTLTLNRQNGSVTITGFTSGGGGGDSYWTSGSTGTNSIKAINSTGLEATGDRSVVINNATISIGNDSFAQGSGTTSVGIASHAEGQSTIASGESSHAEGVQTTASGDSSHAEGYQTIAIGYASHVEGESTKASGDSAHAEGYLTTAVGDYSHAEGSQTKAFGDESHAEGINTTSLGDSSHAEGRGTLSVGDYSHAEGSTTTSIGFGSHAQGDSTIAVTDFSFASGSGSTASGEIGFIHSSNSLVSGHRSVVLGGQNITGSTDDTVYVPNFNINTTPTTNNSLTNFLVRETNGDISVRGYESINYTPNLVTVALSGGSAQFTSIKSAVDSITAATSANTYVVKVGAGVFYEDTITMKSYVDVVGESETNTIIQANNPNVSLIIGADQSMINNVQIQGCTGTSVAAIVYSSSTIPQLNAIFYVENVRFGANYTHVKNVGTGGGNSIIQCSNVKYGGYPFTLGFYCTNDGSGIGRMQLRNVTSTNGGVTTTTGLTFAKADKSGCGFIVNGCLLTKAVGSAAGIGFHVEDGGFLRLTGVNFQRWSTGIYVPQVGSSAPSIDAIALNFENCTQDVNIIHSGTTGKIQGTDNFLKTYINIDAPIYEVNTDPREIVVAKKGGDFSSIKAAVDYLAASATTSSSSRYIISVGPGVFFENEIDLTNTPYVSIVGSNIQTTQILPNTPNQHIIKIGINNEISFLSLSGAPSGYAGIYCYDVGDFAQAHKLSFYDCDTNIWIESDTQDTKFYGEYIDFNGTYSYGTKVVANNNYLALANVENYYNFPTSAVITYCNYATGSGATLSVFVGDNVSNGVAGTVAYYIQDGANLNASTITADGFTYGLRNPNVGLPIRFDVDNVSFAGGDWDMYIERAGTFGTFAGSSSHEKIYTISTDVYWSFLDIDDGELDITRKASVTFSDGTHTDFTTLIFEGSTMGLMEGGEITHVSGFTFNTATGYGYLAKTLTPDIHMRIDWSGLPITLGANENKYIFINENGILSSSGTRPNSIYNIVLGRIVTNSIGVEFIDLSPADANHTSNKFGNLFREAMGPIYASGSIVTENTTPFRLDVTTGEYYYSTSEYLPTGGTAISFTEYYRDGIGGWNTSATTIVNNTSYDGNGSLSALSASYYTKHTLYVVGDGSYEKYLLVLGQNQYSTLVEAEGALLPTPPTFFTDSVSQVANIYIQQGTTGITQVEDIRPTISFRAGGVNASSVHGNLLGLGADDHTQYLLVDGSRAMSGDLDVGSNNITNVGTVDGVDISSHAIRHQFGGADQVGTTTPSPNAIPYADVSGKLDDWISSATTSTRGLVKMSVAPTTIGNPIAVGTNDPGYTNAFTATTYSANTLTSTRVNGTTSTTTIGLSTKAGTVAGASFAGNPKKYTVTFTTAYPSTNYSIQITGGVNRTFTYESKATTGFVINANANTSFTENVDWITIGIGES